MGKFTDWMMKGMDDGEERDDERNNKRGRYENNFDRYAQQNGGYREERQSFREERPSYREERPSFREERQSYREERPSYREDYGDNAEYSRASEQKMEQQSTLPLVNGVEGSSAVQNVVLYAPKSFADVQTLIDFLKRNEPSVVNLASVGDASAQRILDFLSGAIYALNGSIHRISGSIFLLTPSGITITVPNDIKRRLEGK